MRLDQRCIRIAKGPAVPRRPNGFHIVANRGRMIASGVAPHGATAAIRRTGLVVDEWAILGSFSLTLLRWHPSKLRARLLGDMRAWGTDTALLEGLSPQLPLGTGDSLRTLVTVGMGMGTEH